MATLERLLSKGYLRDTLEGTFDVTNLGALMLARDLSSFELLTDAEAEAIEAAYPTSFAGLNLPPDVSDDGDADGGVA